MLGRVVSGLHLLHCLLQQTHTLLADQLVDVQTLNCLPTHMYNATETAVSVVISCSSKYTCHQRRSKNKDF